MQIQRGDATRPSILMTNAEKFFLLAEAAERYGIASFGTAKSNYEAGVKEDFRLKTASQTFTPNATLAVADEASARYLVNGIKFADWSLATTQDDRIRTILIQKWVSLVHVNGLEAWSEYRKSSGSTAVGVPLSVRSVSPSAEPNEPVRFFYPLREESVNSSNVPKGINVFTSKIFWDVN
jgi:hypothetical protein